MELLLPTETNDKEGTRESQQSIEKGCWKTVKQREQQLHWEQDTIRCTAIISATPLHSTRLC